MISKKSWYTYLIEYTGISIGTIFMGIALNLFLEPHLIAPGGVTGFAIVIKRLINIDIDITNLVINIPLFIAGVLILGKSFGAKTLYATIALSACIRFLPHYSATENVLLAAIFGGVLIGIGLGIVFKFGGTTGGTDLGGAILNNYFKRFSTSSFMMAIDLLVVAFAAIVNKKLETALYSIIALYILVKVIDQIIEGLGYAKAAILKLAEYVGPAYIRLGRSGVPVLFDENDYNFEIGKGILLEDGNDVTVIATGVMVGVALEAREELLKDGIDARVINIHTIKPIDKEIIIKAAKETGAIVTAEEHNIIGGLGSAVSEVLSEEYPTKMRRIGVNDTFGESGDGEELLRK